MSRVRLGTAARLWAAAALSVVPLGLGWSFTSGFLLPGFTLPGNCSYADTGAFCVPDQYVPGTYLPGHVLQGSQSPARLFLVAAAIAFGLVATGTRTAVTRRLARLATGSLAVTAVLALADRATLSLSCALLALALVVPPVWGRPTGRALAPASARR